MLYFTNPVGLPDSVVQMARDGYIGFIDTPKQGTDLPAGVPWCADNGCFGKGWPGSVEWLCWLDEHSDRVGECWFATAPDVVGDARATSVRSRKFLPEIRKLGYPPAYVAQDGIQTTDVPWDLFDVLFLGGTTEFKLGPWARMVTAQALQHGKTVHMGRVNSLKRIRYAQSIGCSSVDGTHLTYGSVVKAPELRNWMRRVNAQ